MAPGASKTIKRKAPSPSRSLGIHPVVSGKASVAPWWQRPWILAVILSVLTIAAYLPVHTHPFFNMDDQQYVVNNARIQNGFDGDMIGWAFTTYDMANWHPVTWFSHTADVQLFRLDPAGHHDVNLLLHVLDVVLLFWVLLSATGYSGRSFMVAALFALHPINVETVAWVAERKNVLSMLFFLLALGAYRSYVREPRAGRYLVVALLFALGLMAKPQIITFPFVLLLWDYWPLRRMFATLPNTSAGVATTEIIPAEKFWRLVLEKVPLFALSLGSAIMTMKAQGAAGAMRYYPLSIRWGNAIVSYVRYIGKAFWPWRLVVFYPHLPLRPWQVWAATLLLLGITALVLQRRLPGYLPVGWFWYLGTLVPMIGLVQVGEQAMADRYAYLSFIGLFLILCWGAADLAEQRHLAIAWIAAPSLVLLALLTVMTARQVYYWGDNVRLWSHVEAITDGSYESEENLGVALLESGNPDQAMPHFERVTNPGPIEVMDRERTGYAAVAHLYLGSFDQKRGRPADAIAHYNAGLELAHRFTVQNLYGIPTALTTVESITLGNMGDAYYALHDYSGARSAYERSLQMNPHSQSPWFGLGVVEQRTGNVAAAIEAYTHANQVQSTDVGLLLLAQACEQSGQKEKAQAARRQAELISQNLKAAQQTANKLLTQ